ncbi:hypothetical protein [uncultured Aquimarina sp.]|uniref:hypothetical protein n=1 Tax=uncultured Aquimarina sp. TaxID=575652 RepID=UPI00262F973F|nr:hypothetical protein [uncultured Aquimarina sp.]
MKNLSDSKAYLLLVFCGMFIASCENSEVNSEISNISEKEDFMSTTGKSETFLDLSAVETNKPVLHGHYDGDLSEAEAKIKFEEAVVGYKQKNIAQNKSFAKQWFYRIATKTRAAGENDGTDGKVIAAVVFDTKSSGEVVSINVLDNPGNDREGGWDYYLFIVNSSSNYGEEWVSLDRAAIGLQGRDGWNIQEFNVYVSPYDNSNASGVTSIISTPNRWLDNDASNGWDFYNTNSIGTGRVNFPWIIPIPDLPPFFEIPEIFPPIPPYILDALNL